MASDDRDRTFEKALARHLRTSASSTPDAGTPLPEHPAIAAPNFVPIPKRWLPTTMARSRPTNAISGNNMS